MAIFSKKENTEVEEKAAVVDPSLGVAPATATTDVHSRKQSVILIPRLSEKAYKVVAQNKYVFTVASNLNKVEVRKAVEKQYGVKVAFVNMVVMKGKFRTYGKTAGRTSNYKKAVVTLTPDSKKIEAITVS